MRIFHWIHRKFRQNNDEDYDYDVKDSSDVSGRWPRILQDKTPCLEKYLDERAKRVRIQTEDKVKGCSGKDINHSSVDEDTEALLGPRNSTVTELFSNWQNGLLTIGTFGIDQNGQDYGYESMDTEEDFLFKQADDEEELVDPIEVEVLEGKLEELFGLKNKDPHVKQNKALRTEHKGFVKEYSTSDFRNKISGYENKDNINHGNKIYPLQEFFEVPLLAGTVTKKEHRTTLADLFSRSKNYTSSSILDNVPKEEFRSEAVDNKMKDETQVKSGRSFVKKVLKWKKKGDLPRPKQWMMKMLKKKIHPEVVANEAIEYLDVSKTFVNASQHKELNIYNSWVDGKDSLTRETSELASLLRDSSRGSQECWIKTDSEYVVLEL